MVYKTNDTSFSYILNQYKEIQVKAIDNTKFQKIILSRFPEVKAYAPILQDEFIDKNDFRQVMSNLD